MRQSRIRLIILILIIIMVLSGNAFLIAAGIDNTINMNFKEADVRDVLRTIAELAEVNLVTDGSVNGNITIHLKNITFLDALELITQTNDLAYKWYENTVVVATPERIEEIYSRIELKTINIKYANLVDVQELVNTIYPELNTTIDNRNQTLILKGKAEDIESAEKFIMNIDTPIVNKVTQVISVEDDNVDFLINYLSRAYPELITEANGKNIVITGTPDAVERGKTIINKLINELDSVKTIANAGEKAEVLVSIPARYTDVYYLEELITSMYPEIKIIADKVNQQLIISSNNAIINQIKDLINKVDIPQQIKETEDRVINIQYADLDLVKSSIERIVPELKFTIVKETKQLYLNGSREDIENAIKLVQELDIQERKITRVKKINYLSLEDIEGIVTEFYPGVKYILNQQNREIVLNGREKTLEDLIALITKIDQPRRQVVIEARIEEISSRNLQDMGINPDDLTQIKILDENDDGNVDGIGLTFAEFLKLIEQKGSSNTLANPRLMTISGEKARLLIGDRIPVQVETVKDGQVTWTIEYIEAGITLEFTPWISEDNKITMEISPKVSSIGESIGTALPPINTREAETKIRLSDGETFAIGGLIQDDVLESISRVPLLSEIPIFGELFKHNKEENIKTEVIIFITPHIVESEEFDGENMPDENKEEQTEKKPPVESSDNEIQVENNDKIEGEMPDDKKKENENEIIGLTDEELEEILGGFSEQKKINNKNPGNSLFQVRLIDNENLESETIVGAGVEKDGDDQNEAGEDVVGDSKQVVAAEPEPVAEQALNEKQVATSNNSKPAEEENIAVTLEITEPRKEEEQEGDYYLVDYLVKEGEDVGIIAAKFGISKERILSYNKVNSVASGMVLTIPVPETHLYTLKKGETLWRVHQKFNVDLQLLTEINNIEDYTNLPVGKILVLPKAISE